MKTERSAYSIFEDLKFAIDTTEEIDRENFNLRGLLYDLREEITETQSPIYEKGKKKKILKRNIIISENLCQRIMESGEREYQGIYKSREVDL